MTADTKESVPLQTVLCFIDAGEVTPYAPEVLKSRLIQQAQYLLVGPFGRVIQARARLLDRRDGAKQEIAAHGGGHFAVLVHANRLIAVPDLASAWAF